MLQPRLYLCWEFTIQYKNSSFCFVCHFESFDLLVCSGLWHCDTTQNCSLDVQYSGHACRSVSILSDQMLNGFVPVYGSATHWVQQLLTFSQKNLPQHLCCDSLWIIQPVYIQNLRCWVWELFFIGDVFYTVGRLILILPFFT